MHTRAIQPSPKVQCDEAEIEDKYDTGLEEDPVRQ